MTAESILPRGKDEGMRCDGREMMMMLCMRLDAGNVLSICTMESGRYSHEKKGEARNGY